MCSISYKGKNEQDYFKIEQKIMAEHPYISLSRYYGTDWTILWINYSELEKKGLKSKMIFKYWFSVCFD